MSWVLIQIKETNTIMALSLISFFFFHLLMKGLYQTKFQYFVLPGVHCLWVGSLTKSVLFNLDTLSFVNCSLHSLCLYFNQEFTICTRKTRERMAWLYPFISGTSRVRNLNEYYIAAVRWFILDMKNHFKF